MLTIGLVVAMTMSAVAQPNEIRLNEEKNYFAPPERYRSADNQKVIRLMLGSLRFDNYGVVESVLASTAYMRIAVPEADMSELLKKTEDLAINSPTELIRARASVTRHIFANPHPFANLLNKRFETSEAFFYAATVQLALTYFAQE
jgi:hypothetical protein